MTGFQRNDDVIVVGGGIIGLTTAYFLARAGLRVRLFDKGKVGTQQSGRNWGFISRQGCAPREVELEQDSSVQWSKLASELGEELTVVRGGIVDLAANDKAMSGYRHWIERSSGSEIFGSTLLGQSEVADLLPAVRGSWVGGLYTAGDAHAVPKKAMVVIADAVRGLGAVIQEDTVITALSTSQGRVDGVMAANDRYSADVVVCCTGAWTRRLLKPLGVRLPVRLIRATAARTTAVEPFTDVAVDTPQVSFSQARDGTVTFGSAAWSDYDLTTDSLHDLRLFLPNFVRNHSMIRVHIGKMLIDDVARKARGGRDMARQFYWPRVDEPSPNLKKIYGAFQALQDLVPATSEARVDRIWAGMIDVTPDAVPVIDKVKSVDGLIVAAGFSSHGFGLGPGAGHAIAELIVRGRSPVDLSPFTLDRFKSRRVVAYRHL